jgi:homoserine kinase
MSGLFPTLSDIQNDWPFLKRISCVTSVSPVPGFWAVTVATPGTEEGTVYMRTFLTLEVHLCLQPEIISQEMALALFIAAAMMERPHVDASVS